MRCLLAFCCAAFLAASGGAAAEFELAYTGPADSSALDGLRLGVEESNLQGEFLGVSLVLKSDGRPMLESAIAVFADRPGGIGRLAAAAEGRPVFNLSDRSDELRSACLSNALHVIPSDAMLRDAVEQWRQARPNQPATAAAWHSSAVKFAARDLNRRFLERFGAPMDDLAWAGWFAARAVGDTLMRNPAAGPGELLESLKRADGLDGQKGDPHSFRASGQLRQGLVFVSPEGGLLGEAPVRGVPGGLESLGNSPCE